MASKRSAHSPESLKNLGLAWSSFGYRRSLRVRLLLLDFLAFSLVYPAQALLNSTPQLLARDRRAVAQGAQFGPGEKRTVRKGDAILFYVSVLVNPTSALFRSILPRFGRSVSVSPWFCSRVFLVGNIVTNYFRFVFDFH